SLEPRMAGDRTDPNQPYSWPRTLTAVVPEAIKQSQMIAAMAVDSGVTLMSIMSGPQIIREKVGPIETQYAEGYSGDVVVNQIEQLIAPFIKGNKFFPVSLVRV
ncbi:MAG: DnaT-like ssDNA-binding protein, partial [Plesiomonas shigelloides]